MDLAGLPRGIPWLILGPIAPEQGLLPRQPGFVLLYYFTRNNTRTNQLPANLEVKSKAPNGVTFTVKGKSAHEGPIAGQVRSSSGDIPHCRKESTVR